MLTSFAPSPIARVVTCGFSLIIRRTISAFYLGDIRQAISTEEEQATLRNYLVIRLLLIISKRDSPDTTVADVLKPSDIICLILLSAI